MGGLVGRAVKGVGLLVALRGYRGTACGREVRSHRASAVTRVWFADVRSGSCAFLGFQAGRTGKGWSSLVIQFGLMVRLVVEVAGRVSCRGDGSSGGGSSWLRQKVLGSADLVCSSVCVGWVV